MASNVEYFLKKTLGEDFLQSLNKVELWKPSTKSTVDHEELRTALQIVPRTIMALLIRELAPLEIGSNHKFILPVPGEEATLFATKLAPDVYSGEITQGSKTVVDFKLRALPGIGLVVMSAFELYDMENLINSPNQPSYNDNLSEKVQKLIDDRLALHDLIGKVVDKKIMEREAIHQLVLRKLTEMSSTQDKKDQESEESGNEKEVLEMPANVLKNEAPKKKIPLHDFLEKRKNKKNEHSIIMTKNENVQCDTCGKRIFNNLVYSGCICMGENMDSKIYIKKSENGIKIRFPKSWDKENIELLLDVLRRKK